MDIGIIVPLLQLRVVGSPPILQVETLEILSSHSCRFYGMASVFALIFTLIILGLPQDAVAAPVEQNRLSGSSYGIPGVNATYDYVVSNRRPPRERALSPITRLMTV